MEFAELSLSEEDREVPGVLRALSRHRRQEVPAQGHRSRRHGRADLRGQAAGQGGARGGGGGARGAAGATVRPGSLGRAADLPGDGRRRQGRRDRARDVRRQSPGLPGALLQGAVPRGARPRLPLALPETPARARPHRHLQPLLLRGGARGPGAQGAARGPEAAAVADHQVDLGGPLRGHPQRRALPWAQRHPDPQVLPPRLEEGAEAAVPGASRQPREELEVLDRPTPRSAATGTTTRRRTRT